MGFIQNKKKAISAFVAILCAIAIIFAVLITLTDSEYDISHLKKLQSSNEFLQGKPFVGEKGNAPKGMVMGFSNEHLELYVNKKTAELAVKDKKTNKLWYTNPIDRESDAQANAAEKEKLASQVSIEFIDSLQRESRFSSFADCVKKEQFEIQSIDNGIRIIYTMGDIALGSGLIPKYITPSRLEEKILSKLDEKKKAYFIKRYTKSNKEGFLQIVGENLTSPIAVERILAILDEVGYTPEDLAYENELSGHASETVKPYVVMPIDFTLIGDELSVTIPLSQVENEESMRLSEIELLNWFGAGGKGDKGYMLVPSGSGGIINFNNGKQREDSYRQPVYGTDTVMLPEFQMQFSQATRLPVFGIKNNEAGFVAYIEKGAAIASISADVSGRSNGYNNVYPRFMLRTYETINMNSLDGKASDMKSVEKNAYTGDITVNYRFLPQKQTDYLGMAQVYQDTLIQKGILTPRNESDISPFYLSVIGAVQKQEIQLGMKFNKVSSITTVEQANVILDELENCGITDVQLRYQGWFNRGINHDIPKNINIDNIVGSKKELINLQQRLNSMGGGFYPDVAFGLSPLNSKSYSKVKDAARTLKGYSATMAPYNPASLFMTTSDKNSASYINSPKSLPRQVDGFLKDYNKLSFQNISLRDTGDILSSDKHKKRPIDREMAMLITSEQMNRIGEETDKVMVSGGNQYSLQYANHVINAPTSVDRFYIIDEEIPFYQMVLHGYVDYTGSPINTADIFDKEMALLKAAEFGLAPHFLWTYEKTEELEKTQYNALHSTYYKDWISVAQEFNDVSKKAVYPVRNARMIKHKIHENGIREIGYDNGITIYVNYTEYALTANGVTVKAKSYSVERG